jgi:hypothetical protein
LSRSRTKSRALCSPPSNMRTATPSPTASRLIFPAVEGFHDGRHAEVRTLSHRPIRVPGLPLHFLDDLHDQSVLYQLTGGSRKRQRAARGCARRVVRVCLGRATAAGCGQTA